MCAYIGKWATFFDGAVEAYYEVISARGETTLTVPAVNVFECVCSALGCGRAMDYYFAYVHIYNNVWLVTVFWGAVLTSFYYAAETLQFEFDVCFLA